VLGVFGGVLDLMSCVCNQGVAWVVPKVLYSVQQYNHFD